MRFWFLKELGHIGSFSKKNIVIPVYAEIIITTLDSEKYSGQV